MDDRPAAPPPAWGADADEVMIEIFILCATLAAVLLGAFIVGGGGLLACLAFWRRRVEKSRLNVLGLVRAGSAVSYAADHTTRTLDIKHLVMIPHGRTPSNQKLLFQSHAEGPDSILIPESLKDCELGALDFCANWGARLRSRPSDFVFLRSPLVRTAQTAEVYWRVLKENGFPTTDVEVDEGLLEIDHASWHGCTPAELGNDKAAALAYRSGCFFASPEDGESNVDLLERCQEWLSQLNDRARGKTVVCFGHGTFQNGIETLLQSLSGAQGGPLPPAAVFTRRPGESHLRRGFAHLVYGKASPAAP